MAFRIVKPDTLPPSKRTKGVKKREYLTWLHDLPCIVSLSMPVEAAHLSTTNHAFGHMGRGKGRKSSDRWALPLSKELHDAQHSGSESAFWAKHGINPHAAALALYGLWSDYGDDATDVACRLIVSKEIGRLN